MAEGWVYVLHFQETRFELKEGEQTVGRSRSCDVAVNDPSVSRKHVILRPGQGYVLLTDLGSSNGTYVNGKKVQGESVLESGDVLRMGDAELRVEVAASGAAPASSRPQPGEATFFLAAESMKLAEALEAADKPAPLATQRIDLGAAGANVFDMPPAALATQRLDAALLPNAQGPAASGHPHETQRLVLPAIEPSPAPAPMASAQTQRLTPEDLRAAQAVPSQAVPQTSPALAPALGMATQRLTSEDLRAAQSAPPAPTPAPQPQVGAATMRLTPEQLGDMNTAPTLAMPAGGPAPAMAAAAAITLPPVSPVTPLKPATAAAEDSFADLDASAVQPAPSRFQPPAPASFAPEPPSFASPASFAAEPTPPAPIAAPSFLPAAPAPPSFAAPAPPAFTPPAPPSFAPPAAPAASAPSFAPPPAPSLAAPPPTFDRPTPPAAPPPPMDALAMRGMRQPSSAGELLPSLDDLEAAISTPGISDPMKSSRQPSGKMTAVAVGEPTAGFGLRLMAYILDVVLLGAVQVAASIFSAADPLITTGVALLSTLVIYFGWAIFGTSPGKRVFGLYIHGDDGRVGIGFLRAFIRLVGYFISLLPLGIGFLMILFTKDHRALHDRLARTWVYRHAG